MTLTIVSGAASGVEQGAIEAAINLALRWQGWASREHLAALFAIYRTGLQETSATDPGMVRRLNCQDADGALVFSTSMVLVGVPAFVDHVTEQMQRAFLHVTLNPAALQSPLPDEVRDHIRDWIRSNELARVYVTGPSSDDVPGIQGAVRDALIAILEPFAVDEIRETTRVLSLINHERNMQALGFGPPGDRYRLGPPEGLDELQRHQLDASIREAERDVRDPVEERVRAYHDLVSTAPGPIGGGRRDYEDEEDDAIGGPDHEPPAPGDQTT
jgi:hypothetical protein